MSDVAERLEQARAAFDRREWDAAHEQLVAIDGQSDLAADDLRRLAESAYLTGHDDAAEAAWSRAHEAFLAAGEVLAAVRCAFWLGLGRS